MPLDRIQQSPGAVALTFDDGCGNLADHAFPLLDRYRFPATVFVVSRYCGRSNQWPGQPSTIPDLPLMSWSQLAAAPACIDLGAHTVTHPNLSQLPADECDRELRQCKDEIEQRLARPVPCLAYPYGASSESVRAVAGNHFDLAVGTALRYLSPASPALNLPRIDMYYFRRGLSPDRLFGTSNRLYLWSRNAIREIRTRIQK